MNFLWEFWSLFYDLKKKINILGYLNCYFIENSYKILGFIFVFIIKLVLSNIVLVILGLWDNKIWL